MDLLFQNILLHGKKIIAAVIILLIPAIYFAGKINLDSSTEIFLVAKDPAKKVYDNFIHDFGSDEILFVMITTDLNSFFNSPLPDQLIEKFNNIPGVTAVYNPLDKYRNALTENTTGINIEELKKKVGQNPFEKKGSMLSFEENYVVYALKVISITADQRGSVFKETQKIMKFYGLDMNSVKIAGQPVLNYYLSETPKEVGNIFFPLLVITSALALYYIFRDIYLIITPILLIVSVQLFVLGFIGLTGKTLNIITTIVPVILYIITLAASIHLLERLVTNRRKGDDIKRQVPAATIRNGKSNWTVSEGKPPAGLRPGMGEIKRSYRSYGEIAEKTCSALHKALYKQELTAPKKNKFLHSNSITDDLLQMMKDKFAPCVFAAFTTAVGFGSLSFSPLVPIKSLGIYLFFGTIFSFILLYTLFPSLLLQFLQKRPVAPKFILTGFFGNITDFTGKWHLPILILSTIPIIYTLYKLPDIAFQTNGLYYFNKDSFIRKNSSFMEDKGLGLTSMELVIEGNENDFKRTEILKDLDSFCLNLEKIEGVQKIYSVSSILKEAYGIYFNSYELPPDFMIYGVYNMLSEKNRDLLSSFVNPRFFKTRVSIGLKTINAEKFSRIKQKVENMLLQSNLSKKMKAHITGQFSLILNAQNYLLETLIKSFSFSFVVIILCFFVFLRNASLSFISIVPNIFPVFCAMGLIFVAKMNFDVGTIMIASVILGIAVDDTAHFLHHLKTDWQKADSREIIFYAYQKTGAAILFTTLILSLGFLVFSLSDFVPIRNLGLLSSFSILVALVGDIILLPSLFFTLNRFFYRRIHINGTT